MNLEEFKITERPWKVFKIDVDFLTVASRTTPELASALAPQFRRILEENHCEMVRGSFHKLTDGDAETFQIDRKPGYETYIIYGVSK